jgi:hypothetical protein
VKQLAISFNDVLFDIMSNQQMSDDFSVISILFKNDIVMVLECKLSITLWANNVAGEEQMGLNSLPIVKQRYIPVGYITYCDLFPGLDVYI